MSRLHSARMARRTATNFVYSGCSKRWLGYSNRQVATISLSLEASYSANSRHSSLSCRTLVGSVTNKLDASNNTLHHTMVTLYASCGTNYS
jgi:hypothetical protein